MGGDTSKDEAERRHQGDGIFFIRVCVYEKCNEYKYQSLRQLLRPYIVFIVNFYGARRNFKGSLFFNYVASVSE